MSEELIPGVMKNIDAKTVVTLKEQVACLPGQVISKTLAQNDAVSVTLFGFGAGEEIASHRAGGDAFVTILEGRANITIDDDVYNLEAGQSIVMPLGQKSLRCCWLLCIRRNNLYIYLTIPQVFFIWPGRQRICLAKYYLFRAQYYL